MKFEFAKIFDLEKSDSWLNYLDEYGYVVIGDILDETSYDNLLQMFKDEWNVMCPDFDFEDKKTWKMENIEPLHSGWNYGMINGHGFGQSDFQWGLRTHKNILKIWEKVHKTEDLVVSFDGLSVFLSQYQEGIMYHTDQHPNDDSLYSVQGAYNFFPVTDSDAGFVVVPKSHKTFNTKCPIEYKFITVDDDDPILEDAIFLKIPKNCFVLWNSKTVHSSIGMEEYKSDNFNRLTSYLCYFPKKLRNEKVKEKRIKGYYNGDNCSHYAIYHQPKSNPKDQNKLTPLLNDDKGIPLERLALI